MFFRIVTGLFLLSFVVSCTGMNNYGSSSFDDYFINLRTPKTQPVNPIDTKVQVEDLS